MVSLMTRGGVIDDKGWTGDGVMDDRGWCHG